MKRRLIFLLLLIIATLTVLTESQAQGGICDSWAQACYDVQEATFDECVDNGGGMDCQCKSFRKYNECMALVGCNGYPEWFMIINYCGPDD